ncbi:MAG: hypothetical protein QN183_06535 [Armatimonadota bacterium]|nr:hypothetical protein [Armatimonadota bacterium]MDR7536004.1 hypothetical protein [Armatimonadota bacterium]
MPAQVVARFAVDHPIRPGMVRAILDTLQAQGGPYVPQLFRRAAGGTLQRLTGARPAGLLDQLEAPGEATFLRVAESRPQPVLSFVVSPNPRVSPTEVRLVIPGDVLASSQEVERLLGVCKGLYLFLEAPWGAVGSGERENPGESDEVEPPIVQWANFLGPELVARVGPARVLTSMAFIVEILPDGGIMLVTHPTPTLAETVDGRALRSELDGLLGVADHAGRLFGGGPKHPGRAGLRRDGGRRIRLKPVE